MSLSSPKLAALHEYLRDATGKEAPIEVDGILVRAHATGGRERTVYVQVQFLEPLELDLLMVSWQPPDEDSAGLVRSTPGGAPFRDSGAPMIGDKLRRSFYWTASDDTLVERLFCNEAGEILLRLARHVRLRVSDKMIEFGPLWQDVEGDTRLAADVITAVGLITRFRAAGSREDACPACNEPVAAEATECPSCGLALASEDEPEAPVP